MKNEQKPPCGVTWCAALATKGQYCAVHGNMAKPRTHFPPPIKRSLEKLYEEIYPRLVAGKIWP